jgi:hypothetical protein
VPEPWLTVHPLRSEDSLGAAALRASVAAFKGKLGEYGENAWAGVKGYLDACADAAAAPVIAKYTGVLAAADVFTASTAFWVMESLRLDLGFASWVHP